jgi:hypothetical protein
MAISRLFNTAISTKPHITKTKKHSIPTKKKKKQRYNKKGKCKKDHKNVQANQEIIKDQSQITYLTNNEP